MRCCPIHWQYPQYAGIIHNLRPTNDTKKYYVQEGWNVNKSGHQCHIYVVMYQVYTFFYHFYFAAQLVGDFTLSDLLDKPWSQVSCLLPPGTCLQFLSRIGFSIPTARRSSWNVAKSHSHMKNKNTACYYKCCCSNTSGVIKCMRVVLLSCHCFRNPDALDPRLGLVRDVRW